MVRVGVAEYDITHRGIRDFLQCLQLFCHLQHQAGVEDDITFTGCNHDGITDTGGVVNVICHLPHLDRALDEIHCAAVGTLSIVAEIQSFGSGVTNHLQGFQFRLFFQSFTGVVIHRQPQYDQRDDHQHCQQRPADSTSLALQFFRWRFHGCSSSRSCSGAGAKATKIGDDQALCSAGARQSSSSGVR